MKNEISLKGLAVMLVLLFVMLAYMFTPASATGNPPPPQPHHWNVFFEGCDGDGYVFGIYYYRGVEDNAHRFSWRAWDGSSQGATRLKPGESLTVVIADNVIKVNGPGRVRYAWTRDTCDPEEPVPPDFEPPSEPPMPAYLIAALDVGDPAWSCYGSVVRDDENNPIVTPIEYMYWNDAGTEIPISVLILSDYIPPSECTVLDPETLEPIEGTHYVDYDRFTCIAYLGEDDNCPGAYDYH